MEELDKLEAAKQEAMLACDEEVDLYAETIGPELPLVSHAGTYVDVWRLCFRDSRGVGSTSTYS